MAEQFDVVVIGGGPGGYAAALYGANASGKSNALSALAFMKNAVVHSHRTIGFEIRQLSELNANSGGLPLLVGAPVGHGIGMLSALLIPVRRKNRSCGRYSIPIR